MQQNKFTRLQTDPEWPIIHTYTVMARRTEDLLDEFLTAGHTRRTSNVWQTKLTPQENGTIIFEAEVRDWGRYFHLKFRNSRFFGNCPVEDLRKVRNTVEKGRKFMIGSRLSKRAKILWSAKLTREKDLVGIANAHEDDWKEKLEHLLKGRF